MAIAALVAWALTVAAGLYLLMSVMAADRAAAAPPAPVTGREGARPTGDAGPPPPVPRAPAPVPRTRASVPPGAHPVLEFCHPALGITGLACWFAFVATHDRSFAWIAIAVLAATIGAGLGWLAVRGRSARRRSARHRADGGSGPDVPAHRVVLHGLIAATTCVLVVVAILAVSHG